MNEEDFSFRSRFARVTELWRAEAAELLRAQNWETNRHQLLFDTVSRAQDMGALKANHAYVIEELLRRFEQKKFHVAKHLGVDPGTITRWCKKGYISLSNLKPRARAYIAQLREETDLATPNEYFARILAEVLTKISLNLDPAFCSTSNSKPDREQCEILVEIFLRKRLASSLLHTVKRDCVSLAEVQRNIGSLSWVPAVHITNPYGMAATYLKYRWSTLTYIAALHCGYLRDENPWSGK